MDYNDVEYPFNELIGKDKMVYNKLIEVSKELELSLYMATFVIKESRFLEANPDQVNFEIDLAEWDNYDFDTFLLNFVDINNNEWDDVVLSTLEFDELLPGGCLDEINHYKKKLPFYSQSQVTQQLFYKVSCFVFFKQSEKSIIIDRFCTKQNIKERELNKLKIDSTNQSF